jgi:hypothetical protein
MVFFFIVFHMDMFYHWDHVKMVSNIISNVTLVHFYFLCCVLMNSKWPLQTYCKKYAAAQQLFCKFIYYDNLLVGKLLILPIMLCVRHVHVPIYPCYIPVSFYNVIIYFYIILFKSSVNYLYTLKLGYQK